MLTRLHMSFSQVHRRHPVAKKTDGFGGGAAGKARRQWMGRGKEPQGNGRCRHKTTARIVKLEEKLVAYVQQSTEKQRASLD